MNLFYDLYRQTFMKSGLGMIKRKLPLHEMAEDFGLARKGMRAKRGRRDYFSPEGKVALVFLKMYTGLSCPKLMEQLNGNIHCQLFCDVIINPQHPLTNYKLLDDIISELSHWLKVQQQQDILAEAWKPYMKALDVMYTDAACFGSRGSQVRILLPRRLNNTLGMRLIYTCQCVILFPFPLETIKKNSVFVAFFCIWLHLVARHLLHTCCKR